MTIFQKKTEMSSPLGCNFSNTHCHPCLGWKAIIWSQIAISLVGLCERIPPKLNPTRPWPPPLINICQGPLRPCSKAFSASWGPGCIKKERHEEHVVWCCLGHRLVLGAWWNSSYAYQPWSTFCNFRFWYLLYGVCIWAWLGPSLIKTIQVSEMSDSFTIMSLRFTQIVDPYDILWNVLQPQRFGGTLESIHLRPWFGIF